MRGLKLIYSQVSSFTVESHLLQMRGLKLQSIDLRLCLIVASFTDAWIETEFEDKIAEAGQVASFTDAWIETFAYPVEGLHGFVASFTDAWIETAN